MKKKPLISVIITYYKKKSFIKKTLKSIFDQTYKNFEVIFVFDDEDTSDIEYIKLLLVKFKKKKIIINKKNLGVAKSRNLAIRHSKGIYLAFIDADDVWKKNKLSNQLNFMEKNSHYFSFTSYVVIDEKDKILKLKKVNFDATYNNLINIGSYIFNSKVLGLMQKETRLDMDQLIKIALKKKRKIKVYCINNSQWSDVGDWNSYLKYSSKSEK